MSQSAVQQESDLEFESEAMEASEDVKDAAMESDSDDEGIQSVRKRSKKMIIDDDEDDDDNADGPAEEDLDDGPETAVDERAQKEASDDELPDNIERSPEPHRRRRINNELAEVLRDSGEEDGDQKEKTDEVKELRSNDDSEESENEAENEAESQGPIKFNGDLFDAEGSSEEDNDLNTAAGPEYDSAEDKDFEESAVDPKLLAKLKKMKGAAKKPRERKSRKCKPTKDDMFALHSETQRLIRETHVSIPYHKPTPKSLQDFLARAQKKQEAYKDMKKGRMLDIEKARIIQEKIAEPVIEKLPSLQKRHSLHRRGKHSSATHSQQTTAGTDSQQTIAGAESQQSLPDSGIVPSGGSYSEDSEHKDIPQKPDAEACLLGEDELPDIVAKESNGLCVHKVSDGLSPSQNTLQGSEIDDFSQSQEDTSSTLDRKNLQDDLDDEDAVVEQFDSSPVTEASEQIEEVESLSVKEGNSQSSLTNVVPESLESVCGENAMESDAVTADRSEQSITAKNTECVSTSEKQLCEEDSGIENDFSKQLNASSPVKAASWKADSAGSKAAASGESEYAAQDSQQNSLKAARQKALAELSQKGVVPAIGKGGGDFIILDEEPKSKMEKQSNIDRLVERLMRHYPKKHVKKSKNLEISIVEQTEDNTQKKELKLTTVTYRTEGEPEMDLSSVAQSSGNRLQALKQKLEVGMQKQRMATYERRRHLYKMENEEGFEEKGDEDGLPFEEEEDEMSDRSDTEDEEEEETDLEEDEEQFEEDDRDRDNPFLDDEAEEDDDEDDYDDGPRQMPVCAEINDMKEDDVDLFQDSEKLQLRLDQSDDEEEDEDEKENGEKLVEESQNSDGEMADETDYLGPVRKSQSRSYRLVISDDDDDNDDGSQLQSAQDPTKTCDLKLIAGNSVKDGLNESFDALTPMTRLMRGTQTQPGSVMASTQPVEDTQDLFGSPEETYMEDPVSQILDADGYFRMPSTQPRRLVKPTLVMESSQDAGNMDELMGLCSGQFAEGSQRQGIPASGGFDCPPSKSVGGGGFEGLFDSSSQSQSDHCSLASLFDNSLSSQQATLKDSQSEGDSNSQLETVRRPFGLSNMLHTGDSGDAKKKPGGGKGLMFSQPQKEDTAEKDDMDEVLGLCSGTFASSDPDQQGQREAGAEKKRGIKRRLLVHDSSDEEDEGATGRFRILSDDEATKDSDKNELSGSDEEDHNSDAEEEPTFRGFKNKGKMMQQFVEDEAELSGSEEESDDNLDIDEEDDYMEEEAGDTEVLNEEQLRDQVGRVHMKQMLDDDDRQLMRYKEMYLPDGDMFSEGGGRQRRFHWKHLGDEASQNDLFSNHSDEEKEEVEDADEKQWRMERFEREKFLESQKEDGGETGEEENSKFLKFGQFFMKRQVSEPAELPKQPTLAKPKIAKSQSVADKCSPGKFLKPKIPKRGSFLTRSKENLAKIAEITKGTELNVNGTRGSRSFVFSIHSSEKSEESGKEQLLTKAASKASLVAKKVTPHKPPAKKQCVQPICKPKPQKSIFKLLEK